MYTVASNIKLIRPPHEGTTAHKMFGKALIQAFTYLGITLSEK